MPIEVLYFAELKDITKKPKELFNEPISNMKELLALLFKTYNSLRNVIWDGDSDNLCSNVSIAVNDVLVPQMDNEDKLSLSLSDGDKIAFLLPISGG